jgi:hypothetical protein
VVFAVDMLLARIWEDDEKFVAVAASGGRRISNIISSGCVETLRR